MTNFTKAEFAAALAEEAGITKAVASIVLDHVCGIIKTQTDAGKSITLPGFGKFSVKERAARTGRNPATGEPIQIAASRSLTFKPSKSST